MSVKNSSDCPDWLLTLSSKFTAMSSLAFFSASSLFSFFDMFYEQEVLKPALAFFSAKRRLICSIEKSISRQETNHAQTFQITLNIDTTTTFCQIVTVIGCHAYHNTEPYEQKHLPTSPNRQLYKSETFLSPPFCPYYRTCPNVTSKGLP